MGQKGPVYAKCEPLVRAHHSRRNACANCNHPTNRPDRSERLINRSGYRTIRPVRHMYAKSCGKRG